MIFQVMSRKYAVKYAYKIDVPTIIISINDMESVPPHFVRKNNIVDVLTLFFEDVDYPGKDAITIEDANKIIHFVNQYKDKVEQIIVHCEAGVSRSAGVCAALIKIFDGDDNVIFDNGQYCPNMTCYRTVLQEYYGKIDEDKVKEKELRSITNWRKAQDLD